MRMAHCLDPGKTSQGYEVKVGSKKDFVYFSICFRVAKYSEGRIHLVQSKKQGWPCDLEDICDISTIEKTGICVHAYLCSSCHNTFCSRDYLANTLTDYSCSFDVQPRRPVRQGI
jgi:hypothetical protein